MRTLSILAAFTLAATAALAQPPPRELFGNDLTTVSGQIVSIDLSQPGASVRVKDDRSGVVWKVVGPTSNTLVRGGLSADMTGTLTVAGYASKACATECGLRMRQMTFPDGRKVFLGASGPQARS